MKSGVHTKQICLPGLALVPACLLLVGMLKKASTWIKKRLADEAIYLERVLCNEAGDWQNQIAAAFGGMRQIEFNKDGSNDIRPTIIHLDNLEPYSFNNVVSELKEIYRNLK